MYEFNSIAFAYQFSYAYWMSDSVGWRLKITALFH